MSPTGGSDVGGVGGVNERSPGTDGPAAATRAPEGRNAIRLGFWVSILTVSVTAVFMVMAMATPPRSGPFCASACVPYPYTDVAAFIPQDYLWLYPGFLLAPIVVILVACIHGYARGTQQTFSRIGLSLSILYAAVILVDYFIQLTVVAPSLQAGERAGLSLFTQYNPHGIFITFEALGYLLLSLAFLFLAPVFTGGRKERVIRWTFVAGFVAAVLAYVALPLAGYDIVAFEVTALLIDWIVLIVAGVLLSLVFRGAARLDTFRRSEAAGRGLGPVDGPAKSQDRSE